MRVHPAGELINALAQPVLKSETLDPAQREQAQHALQSLIAEALTQDH